MPKVNLRIRKSQCNTCTSSEVSRSFRLTSTGNISFASDAFPSRHPLSCDGGGGCLSGLSGALASSQESSTRRECGVRQRSPGASRKGSSVWACWMGRRRQLSREDSMEKGSSVCSPRNSDREERQRTEDAAEGVVME